MIVVNYAHVLELYLGVPYRWEGIIDDKTTLGGKAILFLLSESAGLPASLDSG